MTSTLPRLDIGNNGAEQYEQPDDPYQAVRAISQRNSIQHPRTANSMAASSGVTYRVAAPTGIPESSLTSLLHRLEAATSRLEDIASSTGVALDSNGATPGAAAAPPGSRQVAGAATSVPASTGQVPSPSPGGELPSTVRDFDQLLQGDLQSWVSSSESIGPVIAEQVRYRNV